MSDLEQPNHHQRARALALLFAIVVFFVTWAVTAAVVGWWGIALGLVAAGIWTGMAWSKSGDAVLDLSDAAAADEHAHARLFNTTAGLCTAMGVAPPSLYVVDDPGLNVLATGTDTRSASLVVTEGVLDEFSVLELEAVVAFGLHRIKSGIVVPETLVVTTVGAALVLSEAADSKPWLARLLELPAAPILGIISRIRPPRQDVADDLATVGYTRSPPALASALEKMSGHSALAVAPKVIAHLWMAPPLGTSARSQLADLHTSLDERVAVLREL